MKKTKKTELTKTKKLKRLPLVFSDSESVVQGSAFDLGARKRPKAVETVPTKRKKQVEEDEPPKKKKKKKSTARFRVEEEVVDEIQERAQQLAPLRAHADPDHDELLKIRQAKKAMRHLEGTFKEYVPEATMLLERENLGSSAQLIQRGMLMTLLSNIPLAENAYQERPSQSNAIALQALINSGRDVLAEIEQQNDGSELLTQLMNEILLPNFQEIAHHLVMALFQLRADMQNIVPNNMRPVVDTKFNEISTEIRGYLSDKFVDLREKTMERLKQG